MLIKLHEWDIILISETHLTDRHNIKIRNFNIYNSNHPDGTAHAGAAIIVKSSIKHHLHSIYRTKDIQAATITTEDKNGPFNIAAVYCPPGGKIKTDQLINFFLTLDNRFIAGGDWNAKHVHWGSRLTTTRGRDCLIVNSGCNITRLYGRSHRYSQ